MGKVHNLIIIRSKEDFNIKILEAEYNRNSIEKEPIFALKNWLIDKYTDIIEKNKNKRIVKQINQK